MSMFDTIISIAIAFFGAKEPPMVVAYGKIKIALRKPVDANRIEHRPIPS
jgi:hypothetical protein